MCWPTEGLKQNSERVQKRDRETSDHGHFAFLSDVKTTNSGKCQSNCHTFSAKRILGNFSGCSMSISIHTSICTDPEAFSCLSPSLSLSVFLPVGCWLFHCDIWGHVCLAQSDIFNSVSFGLHVGLKAQKLHQKLHTNCIRLPTCWKGKLLANLLWVLTSSPVWWKFWSNWSPALHCAPVMRVREHLLDWTCPVDLIFSYLDVISL